MGKRLTSEQLEAYRRDGFLYGIPVLSRQEVAHYRACAEDLLASCGDDLKNHLLQVHLVQRWADELIRHPAVLDAVEDTLGPNILAWKNKCFYKSADATSYVSWHQDNYNEHFDNEKSVTAWIALSDSHPAHGCVRGVVGSHLGGRLPHVEEPTPDNLSTRGPKITAAFDTTKAAYLTLDAGQMSLHHPCTIHGSDPNESGEPRIGFATAYIAASVRQMTAPTHGATLVRGKDTLQFFPPNPVPTGDDEALKVEARETFRKYKEKELVY